MNGLGECTIPMVWPYTPLSQERLNTPTPTGSVATVRRGKTTGSVLGRWSLTPTFPVSSVTFSFPFPCTRILATSASDKVLSAHAFSTLCPEVFVTHSDSGRWVFYSSALAGTVLAAAASNLYYPRQDRGFGPSLDRAGIDLGDTALFNVAAEFWPDIKHRLYLIF